MSAPTPEDAIAAWEISESTGVTPIRGKDGLWRPALGSGVIVAAGAHLSPHAAVLAAPAVLAQRESRRRQDRAVAALVVLQTASYFPRPREIPNPSPEPGEPATIRVWDIIKVGGVVSTVTGRVQVLIAIEDAELARIAGTL